MRQLWVGSWMGDGHQKDKAMIRSFIFSGLHHPFSREGRGVGNEINNRLILCVIASIKSQQHGVWRVFSLVNTSRCQEGDVPQLHRDRISCTQNPPRPLVNIRKCSLSSRSRSSKYIKPEEVVLGTSDLQPSQTEFDGNLGTCYLQLASEARGSLLGLSP